MTVRSGTRPLLTRVTRRTVSRTTVTTRHGVGERFSARGTSPYRLVTLGEFQRDSFPDNPPEAGGVGVEDTTLDDPRGVGAEVDVTRRVEEWTRVGKGSTSRAGPTKVTNQSTVEEVHREETRGGRGTKVDGAV